MMVPSIKERTYLVKEYEERSGETSLAVAPDNWWDLLGNECMLWPPSSVKNVKQLPLFNA